VEPSPNVVIEAFAATIAAAVIRFSVALKERWHFGQDSHIGHVTHPRVSPYFQHLLSHGNHHRIRRNDSVFHHTADTYLPLSFAAAILFAD
jgi:hypothetical protein